MYRGVKGCMLESKGVCAASQYLQGARFRASAVDFVEMQPGHEGGGDGLCGGGGGGGQFFCRCPPWFYQLVACELVLKAELCMCGSMVGSEVDGRSRERASKEVVCRYGGVEV